MKYGKYLFSQSSLSTFQLWMANHVAMTCNMNNVNIFIVGMVMLRIPILSHLPRSVASGYVYKNVDLKFDQKRLIRKTTVLPLWVSVI